MRNIRRYSFQINHDGQVLHGEIVYNSKDYHIALLDPFYARNSGSHLMYMIPARYTTPIDVDRDQRTDGVIRLEERAEQELIEIYEVYKDIPFAKYVEQLLHPHEESIFLLLGEYFDAIRTHECTKCEIKGKFSEGVISNKEQSQQIQAENRSIRVLLEQINTSFAEYCANHDIQIPSVHKREVKEYLKKRYNIHVGNISS